LVWVVALVAVRVDLITNGQLDCADRAVEQSWIQARLADAGALVPPRPAGATGKLFRWAPALPPGIWWWMEA
jgi:hypothetical protein